MGSHFGGVLKRIFGGAGGGGGLGVLRADRTLVQRKPWRQQAFRVSMSAYSRPVIMKEDGMKLNKVTSSLFFSVLLMIDLKN